MKILIFILLTLPITLLGQPKENLPYIQRDNFASNAFGFPINIKNFKKNYSRLFTITKMPVRNKYDKSIVDTVYTLSKGKTKIEIYHSKEKDLLQSAYIDTDKILLKYNIKVGNTKAEIAKLLKAKITKNKVQIGDLEHGQIYTFSFAKDRLNSISYEGYME